MSSDARFATKAIRELAGAQHGVVSRRQLIELGLSPRMIDSRVRELRLSRIFYGVYTMGSGTASQRGMWLAGTLSSGARVALSHRSAAMLWGLTIDFRFVEVVSASMRRARTKEYIDKGLIVHQTRSLPEEHLTHIEGIPATSLSRTLVDLGSVIPLRQLEALFNEADRIGMLDLDNLLQALEVSKGKRGVGYLKKLAAQRDPRNRLTRSELESRFLTLCSDHGLPLPEVNCLIEGFEVDCYWHDLRFIVELDGLSFHSSWSDIERDRKRDSILQSAGYLILRLTYRAVTDEPQASVKAITAHLRRAEALMHAHPDQLPA